MRTVVLRKILALAVVPVTAAALAGGIFQPAHADKARHQVPVPQPHWVANAVRVGDVPRGQRLSAKIYLNGRDSSGLEQLVRRVSDPHSPDYRHYLSPQQFRTRFALDDASLGKVKQWLTGNRLKVDAAAGNRRYLTVSGTAADIERTFATRLSTYRHQGKLLRAATAPASVPTQFAATVIGVSGLSDAEQATHPFITDGSSPSAKPDTQPSAGQAGTPQRNPPPCSAYYGEQQDTTDPTVFGEHPYYAVCGYTPAQLRGAYAIDGQVAQGVPNGRGVTVAIVNSYSSPTLLADANTWAARRREPTFQPGQFQQVNPDGGYHNGFNDGNSCNEGLWYLEQSLDVEAVHAMAPGAGVVEVGAASCDDADQYAALNNVVDQHLADIVSNSWGEQNEQDMPAALRAAFHQTLLQAACEGIGVFFASADSGDNSLYTTDHRPSVDYPASDPLATGVGGTTLAIGAANNYQFETGWANGKATLTNGAWSPEPPGTFAAGGGGGTSVLYNQPYYQTGVVPYRIATRYGGVHRAVPDVAMDGDPNTGLRIGWTQSFPDGDYYGEARFGGTSLSTPLLAGLVAVADQRAGYPHGYLNPLLYELAGTSALHDVVGLPTPHALARQDFKNHIDGDRVTTARSLGFPQTTSVGPGYDDITGVGTLVGTLAQGDPTAR